MKILVAIKRVIDYTVQIRVKEDQTGIDTSHVKWSMNPFDHIAVEEAIRLKEKNIAKEVIVVSIGSHAAQETLRTALAMGADRALLIETDCELQSLAIAKILRAMTDKEQPQLVLLGKQAIDDDNNQTGQMLAGLLNWSQATFVSQLSVEGNHILAVREIDGGLETLSLTLPSVITTDLRLNEPRYLSLLNIMHAKRKAIETIPLQAFNLPTEPRLHILNVSGVTKRSDGQKVANVKELVRKLREEVKL